MRKISLFAIAMLTTCLAFAQQTYKIQVQDARSGSRIEGASIMLKNSQKGTMTAADGNSAITAQAGDVVEISYTGYQTQTLTLTSKMNVRISLESSTMQDIVVIGSRGAARAKTETAIPVDVININQAGLPSARMDLSSVLNIAAPSFNYNKQTGSDGADHIDLGTLRGLGPDQTLVLINGKRRHQTAFVALFGTRGRGNSGTDLNAFPQSAVDRIEILRDGASAQYGSDAMAGVMNIILKKNINQWSVNAGWAGYYDNAFNAYKTRASNQYIYSKPIDGGTFTFSANTGFKISDNGGFMNLSLDYLSQAKTFRQVADTNISTNANALPLNTSRRAFGDGSVATIGAMMNMELPLSPSKKTTFYAFGGFNNKASDAYAYSRNYSYRPERFPADLQGNLLFDADIMKKAADGEIYYNPHIQTKINDVSLATGFKGNAGKGWNWDLSNTIGRNDFHFYGDKTYNASMFMIPGAAIQKHFDDGGFNFLQNTVNLDFNKSFSNVGKGLNLAFGAEFRHEEYRIYKGEEASYKNYHPDPIPYANLGGDSLSPATGSQGFPGFSPKDEIFAKRNNFAIYTDAELKITDAWMVDAAIRGENYSDFGSVLTYKLASRYKVSKDFNLRGSVSTGFRAPSLQQINFSNTLTSFYGGVLVQSRIARNDEAITKAAGIEKLKQETSTNSSLGFAWKAAKGLTVTLDGYMVKVKDRIVLSGLFDKDDNTLPTALTSELDNLGVQTAQFFSNSVNTTNFGLDIILDYNTKIGKNKLKATLAGNIQKMKVDGVNIPAGLNDSYRHQKTFFSDREEAMLIASAPNMKFNLNLEYNMGKWTVGSHINYFGKIKTLGFGWTGLASQAGTGGPGDPAISGSFTGIDPYVDIDGYSDGVNVAKEEFIYNGKATIDLFASYKISKSVSIFIGADNVLNVHPNFAAVPNARYEAFDNESGGAWEPVQMGYNGRRLFSKIAFNF